MNEVGDIQNVRFILLGENEVIEANLLDGKLKIEELEPTDIPERGKLPSLTAMCGKQYYAIRITGRGDATIERRPGKIAELARRFAWWLLRKVG